MVESQPSYLISQRVCLFTNIEKGLVFVAGSASQQFSEDIDLMCETLAQHDYKGYFSILEDKEKGLDALPRADLIVIAGCVRRQPLGAHFAARTDVHRKLA